MGWGSFLTNLYNGKLRTHTDGRKWKYNSSKGAWKAETNETITQGNTGPTGPQGPMGPQGPTGPAASIALPVNLLKEHLPWPISTGSLSWWGSNDSSADIRSYEDAPYGKGVVWRARNNDTTSSADGGFNSTFFDIDSSKRYRVSMYIKQTNSEGTTYWGTHGGGQHVKHITDSTHSSNPYFWHGDLPINNRWYLVVGYIVESSWSGTSSNILDAGIYDCETGDRVLSTTSYKFDAASTSANVRAYQYYNASGNYDDKYFFSPRFDEINGFEPSLNSLLDNKKGSLKVVMAGFNSAHNNVNSSWQPINLNWFETPVNTAYISVSGNSVTFTKAGAYSINYFSMSHDNNRYYAHHRISGAVYHHTHGYGQQWVDHLYNFAHKFTAGEVVHFDAYKSGASNGYTWHAGGTYSMITITYLGEG